MAIEVYPAATLKMHGAELRGYRRSDGMDRRQGLVQLVQTHVNCDSNCTDFMTQNAGALDAAVCIVAALDFLGGDAVPPEEIDVAVREGWIWVR